VAPLLEAPSEYVRCNEDFKDHKQFQLQKKRCSVVLERSLHSCSSGTRSAASFCPGRKGACAFGCAIATTKFPTKIHLNLRDSRNWSSQCCSVSPNSRMDRNFWVKSVANSFGIGSARFTTNLVILSGCGNRDSLSVKRIAGARGVWTVQSGRVAGGSRWRVWG